MDTVADICSRMPGEHSQELELTLPADAPRGDYEVAIGIDSEPMPRIYFATDAPMKDGYYTVGAIKLERK